MSDSGLRSQAPLVVVEAPAGCGKTHQCADYAPEMAAAGNVTRLLILTHTHAACSMFSNRTKAAGSRIEIRTIDSIIAQVAAVYHTGLGLPSDIATWVRQQKDGHSKLATKVAALLARYPIIARRLLIVIPLSFAMNIRIRAAISIPLSCRSFVKVQCFVFLPIPCKRYSAIKRWCMPCVQMG